MQAKWVKGIIPLMLVAGCLGAPEMGERPEDEGLTAEARQAFTIDRDIISVTELGTWPKTVQWCVGGNHEMHSKFSWKVSWSSSNPVTDTKCVSYSTAGEKCNLGAMIDRDYVGATTDFHTGDIANPKYYSVFDHRTSFALSVSPTSPVQAGQSVSLTAPSPHCERHCDGTGTLYWWQRNSNGSWTELTGQRNKCTLTVNSPSVGTETYKLTSTHQGFPSQSNEVTVTWSSCPWSGQTLCSGQCVYLAGDSCNCGSCGNSCGSGWCSNGMCKSSCFAGGTLITMADGSEKPIEDVRVGDWVLGYDTQSVKAVTARVSHTFVHPDTNDSLLLNGTVRVTAEHPFYVNGEWIEAGKLQPGDQIQRLFRSESVPNPMTIAVENLQNVPGSLTTYNLEVENVHNYFAAGYLVHNKPVGCSIFDAAPNEQ
jgi:hypothetical protein